MDFHFGGAWGGLLLGTVESLGKIGDMNQSKMPITEEKVELSRVTNILVLGGYHMFFYTC